MLKKNVLLATIPSDSHSWNLVFMEFLFSDLGTNVDCLGPNTPISEVLHQIRTSYIDMVVISTVNGHGAIEATELARRIRQETGFEGELYIGGKICTSTEPSVVERHAEALKAAGFTRVFDDSQSNSFDAFQSLIQAPRMPGAVAPLQAAV